MIIKGLQSIFLTFQLITIHFNVTIHNMIWHNCDLLFCLGNRNLHSITKFTIFS